MELSPTLIQLIEPLPNGVLVVVIVAVVVVMRVMLVMAVVVVSLFGAVRCT